MNTQLVEKDCSSLDIIPRETPFATLWRVVADIPGIDKINEWIINSADDGVRNVCVLACEPSSVHASHPRVHRDAFLRARVHRVSVM